MFRISRHGECPMVELGCGQAHGSRGAGELQLEERDGEGESVRRGGGAN